MSSNTHANVENYLTTFQEVTRLMSMVHEPQQVMDLVVKKLPILLAVDAATIRLFNAETSTFTLGAAYGVSKKYLSRASIDSTEVMQRVIEGCPFARTSIESLGDKDIRKYAVNEGVKSSLSLPIIYKNKVIGLLRLLTRSQRDFSQFDIDFSMSLAEQVGISLANSTLYRNLNDKVDYFKEILHLSRLVHSAKDLDETLELCVKNLPKVMGLEACTIRLLQPATNRLELVAASGLTQTYLKRGSISREEAIIHALKGQPLAIYDAQRDTRLTYHQCIIEEGIKSILIIPLQHNTEVIGVIRLLSKKNRIFSESEIDFAMAVATEAGVAIQKARVQRQIELLFNQIEEYERFLQTIVDSLWMQLVVVSSDKRIIMANTVFLKSQNLTEEEVLGENYYSICPWANTKITPCPVDQVLANKNPIAIKEALGNTGKWIERHLAPILEGNGVDSVVEAVRDITDQRQLELEKIQRMKLEGVVEMAGTAAHNINTPLFAALGTAQLLQDEELDASVSEDIELIIRNLQNIKKLTREMTAATGFETIPYVGLTDIVTLK